jgi:hypothetical protein
MVSVSELMQDIRENRTDDPNGLNPLTFFMIVMAIPLAWVILNAMFKP